jgi:hypothetical protein
MNMRRYWPPPVWTAAILMLTAAIATAGDAGPPRSSGQTLYAPVYSHIYSGDRERPIYLAVTVSIRNTDPGNKIRITRVDYYDTDGRRLQQFVSTPLMLPPLASTRYVVKESDKAGGSGANCIVQWDAAKPVNLPIVESVMISTASQQGISFTSRAQAVADAPPP